MNINGLGSVVCVCVCVCVCIVLPCHPSRRDLDYHLRDVPVAGIRYNKTTKRNMVDRIYTLPSMNKWCKRENA